MSVQACRFKRSNNDDEVQIKQEEVEIDKNGETNQNFANLSKNPTKNNRSMSIHNLLDSTTDNKSTSLLINKPYSAFSDNDKNFNSPNGQNNKMHMKFENHYSYAQHQLHRPQQTQIGELGTLKNDQYSSFQYRQSPYPITQNDFYKSDANDNNNRYQVLKQQQRQVKPYTTSNENTKQYTNLKHKSKFRRNALQAYISYMTYTDITRRRMNQETNMHKPFVSPSSGFKNKITVQDPKHYPYNQAYQQPYKTENYPKQSDKLIVEQPLTAFLYRSNYHNSSSRR